VHASGALAVRVLRAAVGVNTGRLIPTEAAGGRVFPLPDERRERRMTFENFETREQWLVALADQLRLRFDEAGYPLPSDVRVSCGWPKPGGGGMRHQVLLGTTWFSAADEVAQIFISPALVEPRAVGGTLVHELCHVASGRDAKHGPRFRAVGAALGLKPPWPSTTPGAALAQHLDELTGALGPYPHAELPEPPSNRGVPSVKLTCRECNYIVRVAAAMLDNGQPFCPHGDVLER